MPRSSIGLDIGTKAVGIAEVRHGSGGPALTKFGRARLPAGAVEHGEVHDPDAVGSAISALWKELGLKGRAVHVGVANRHCVVRVVEVPAMSRENLEEAIRFQAQEHIPIPLSDAVMDFEVLEEFDGPDERRMQRVLVVAAEKTTVESLLKAVSAARLEAQTLELNAYPLVRCFDGKGSAEARAIIDVGGGVTNVVVHHQGKILFTRILHNFGGEEFTSAVAEALGLSREEAEDTKRRASAVLRNRVKTPALVGAEGPPDWQHASPTVEESAASVMEPLLERFVTELRGSIDFFRSQPSRPQLETVVLTGGGSLLGSLRERLSDALGIEVQPGHVFERVPVDDVEVSDREKSVAEPFLGVAVGLALAENGG